MIARVATFHQFDPDKLDPAAVEQFRGIIKSTPGYIASFRLRNPETGKAVLVCTGLRRRGSAEKGW